MSDYPWYISFNRIDEHEEHLNIKSVGFACPTDGYVLQIDSVDKLAFFGTFAYNEKLQYRHFYLGPNDEITHEANIKLDLSQKFTGFPVREYMNIMYDDFMYVVHKMLDMQQTVGDIWKMPNAFDCLLYAQEEAAETLSSIILQVRTQDSRNSRTVDDVDTATEMFDTSMMLIRSLIADQLYNGISHEGTINILNALFRRWEVERLDPMVMVDQLFGYLLHREPYSMLFVTSAATINYQEYMLQQNKNPEVAPKLYDDYLSMVFSLIEFIMFHPVVQFQGYRNLAEKKLNKILNKSLQKREQQNVTA